MSTPSRLKSRTFRRVKKVTPGNKDVTHFVKRKPGAPVCAVTGQKLHGIKPATPSGLKKIPKTSRRPDRPYGGVLSSKAMREIIREKARNEEF